MKIVNFNNYDIGGYKDIYMVNTVLGIGIIASAIILLICYIISCITTNEIIYKISTGLAVASLMFIMGFSLSYTGN